MFRLTDQSVALYARLDLIVNRSAMAFGSIIIYYALSQTYASGRE